MKAIVARSRGVADGMSKGVQFLMKKNKIDVIMGTGKLQPGKKIEVTGADGKKQVVEGKHIIIATGARSRALPNLPQDGKKIIGYREAMVLAEQPKSMVVVGSGAIGSEFAYFYNAIGTKVTLVEFMPNIVPVEDEDVSKQLEKSFKKQGIEVMVSLEVTSVDTKGKGCVVTVKNAKGEEDRVRHRAQRGGHRGQHRRHRPGGRGHRHRQGQDQGERVLRHQHPGLLRHR
jgi:dihydrolipoamide dehydrogenase